jgi:hypothetical protein
MPTQRAISDVASALPVIIVIACTAIVAIAISAWLVHDVAHRAIERSSPDKVPAVVLALGSLLHPLRLFLPWSSHRTGPDPLPYGRAAHDETPQNGSSRAGQEGSSNEAQP